MPGTKKRNNFLRARLQLAMDVLSKKGWINEYTGLNRQAVSAVLRQKSG